MGEIKFYEQFNNLSIEKKTQTVVCLSEFKYKEKAERNWNQMITKKNVYIYIQRMT